MSEKFVVKGGLSVPTGQDISIGADGSILFGSDALSAVNTTTTLGKTEAKKNVIPTEYAVASYVDSQLGASNQLTFTSDGAEADLEIELASETLLIQGGSNLTTSASGNQITVAMDDTISVTSMTASSVDINGGTIDGTDVTVGASKTLDVSAGTLTLAAGQITSAMINGDAINGTKIADDAVDSEHIVDGSIDNVHLAGSIENAKLVNDSVTVASGTGMSGGGEVNLGDTLTLTVDSSLSHVTVVGALSGGSISSDFGNINIGSSTLAAGATTLAGNLNMQGNNIAGTSDDMLIQSGTGLVDYTWSSGTGHLALQAQSEIVIDSAVRRSSDFAVTADGTAQDMFTFNGANFHSAKVHVRIGDGTDVTAKELLIVCNEAGASPTFVEYATVNSGNSEMANTWTVSASGGTISVKCQGDNGDTIKGSFELLKA